MSQHLKNKMCFPGKSIFWSLLLSWSMKYSNFMLNLHAWSSPHHKALHI